METCAEEQLQRYKANELWPPFTTVGDKQFKAGNYKLIVSCRLVRTNNSMWQFYSTIIIIYLKNPKCSRTFEKGTLWGNDRFCPL